MNKIIHGLALDVVKTFESNSIDCIITSPPYYQLRDYGFTEQWGMEESYKQYLDNMIALMTELKRVLKSTGTMWINLGDTYSTQQAGNKEWGDGVGNNKIYNQNNPKRNNGDIPNKSLMLIPHRFAIRCIDELGLILRNDVVWGKQNAMPESITDRLSKKHEFFFFFVKQQKYYFDLHGIRDKHKNISQAKKIESIQGYAQTQGQKVGHSGGVGYSSNGKNPGDVSDFWNINTKPSKSEHYATYNTKLIDKPIIAGSPEFICNKCGTPREKIFEEIETSNTKENDYQVIATGKSGGTKKTFNGGSNRNVTGLTDCGCNAGFSGGVILDPFCGTGTTLLRAMELGRKAIGIEGNIEYMIDANKILEEYKSKDKSQGNLFKLAE